MRPLAVAVPVVCLVILVGCAPSGPTAESTIEQFLDAVRTQDVDALWCSMAGVADSEELGADPETRRAGFEQWALSRFLAYEEGRDEGRVELDGTGIVLARLLGLGRGTFYSVEGRRSVGDDGLQLETRLSFGYGAIDLSRFTPGTTFYVAGAPPGRVHAVRVPAGGRRVSVDVLDTLWVRWSLLREAEHGRCPAGWRVAGVEPVEGTATTTEVTWIF